jgi:hypothetical protein
MTLVTRERIIPNAINNNGYIKVAIKTLLDETTELVAY